MKEMLIEVNYNGDSSDEEKVPALRVDPSTGPASRNGQSPLEQPALLDPPLLGQQALVDQDEFGHA